MTWRLLIADCNNALKLNPGDALAHFTRANGRLLKGQYELALADFEVAPQADPYAEAAIYGRGLNRESLGDADGAAQDFQRARELGYHDRDHEC